MTEEEAYLAAVGKGAFAGMNPPKPDPAVPTTLSRKTVAALNRHYGQSNKQKLLRAVKRAEKRK